MWVHQITLLEVECCVKEGHFHDVEKATVPPKFVEGERVTLEVGVVQYSLHLHFPLLRPQTQEVLR